MVVAVTPFGIDTESGPSFPNGFWDPGLPVASRICFSAVSIWCISTAVGRVASQCALNDETFVSPPKCTDSTGSGSPVNTGLPKNPCVPLTTHSYPFRLASFRRN